MTDPRIERVVLMTSARVGKTQCLNNLVGYHIHQDPGPILIVLPTEARAEEWADDELDPMIRDTPPLRAVMGDRKSRALKQRRTHRIFPGGRLYMVGANAPSGLAAKTIRIVLADEVDRFPASAGEEGDPVALAERRANTIWNRKIVLSSTPTIAGRSRIEQAYQASDQRRFWVPCPDCGEHQTLKWVHVQPQDNAALARYHCEACGVAWTDAQRYVAVSRGEWRAEGEFHGTAGFHLNELYSPWRRLAETVSDFVASKDQPEKLKTWINTALGEVWDEASDLPKADILLLRRDTWKRGQIPPGVLFTVGATDVQGDRLVWAVWGFDQHFGQWLVDTGVLPGDPTQPAVWKVHDDLLRKRWLDAWGREVGPDSWGIDSGYLSSHVYAYARRHAGDADPVVRALDGRPGWKLLPIGSPSVRDVDWAGRKIGHVLLYPVGTWDMKSELSGALRLTEQGPGPDGWPGGALRFNELADRGWLDELLSERLSVNPKTGARGWVKIAARNEAWDLAVYTRAQARHLTAAFTADTWVKLAAKRHGPLDAVPPDMAALLVVAPPKQKAAAVAQPAPTPRAPADHPPQQQAARGRSIIGMGRRLA